MLRTGPHACRAMVGTRLMEPLRPGREGGGRWLMGPRSVALGQYRSRTHFLLQFSSPGLRCPQTSKARASSLAEEVRPPDAKGTSPIRTSSGDEGHSARRTFPRAALITITREQQPYSPIQNIMAPAVHRNAPPEPLCEVAVSSRLTRCVAPTHISPPRPTGLSCWD